MTSLFKIYFVLIIFASILTRPAQAAFVQESSLLFLFEGQSEAAASLLDYSRSKRPAEAQAYYEAGWLFALEGYTHEARALFQLARGDDEIGKKAARLIRKEKTLGLLDLKAVDLKFKRERQYESNRGLAVYAAHPQSVLLAGDVLLSVGNLSVNKAVQLRKALKSKKHKEKVSVKIWRRGKRKNLKLEVMEPAFKAGFPQQGKAKPAAGAELLREYDYIEFYLQQKRFITALLHSRRFISRYPRWELPYLYYARAAEALGLYGAAVDALDAAKKYAKKDALVLRGFLKTQRKKLNIEISEKPWEQRAKIAGHDAAMQALVGSYLGFAGGSMTFAQGQSAAALNLRLGRFFSSGFDASLAANWSGGAAASSVDFNAAAMHRLPLSVAQDGAMKTSLNIGASLGFTSVGGAAYGLFSGVSAYSAAGRSIDLNLQLGNGGSILMTVGMTTFFGSAR